MQSRPLRLCGNRAYRYTVGSWKVSKNQLMQPLLYNYDDRRATHEDLFAPDSLELVAPVYRPPLATSPQDDGYECGTTLTIPHDSDGRCSSGHSSS
jgi:hypothetical protein